MASPDPKKDKEEEKTIGGIDPNAFDAQMLLIDAYIGNLQTVGITTEAGPKVTGGSGGINAKVADNVPYLTKGFDSINMLMGLNIPSTRSSISNFITGITPYEIAQIYPKIQFFIVEAGSGQQWEIPLSKNPSINNPSVGVAFYPVKTIGLKSLSLKLDGSTLPFFSKHYVVDSTFSFDSINTFTSKLPGLPITYAEIFRSSGRVGTSIYYTKMSISYDSTNESIVNKYALRSNHMRFMLVLELAGSKISVQENLKVEVAVKYRAREEELFKSNIIFDFLGLDLKGKTKEVRKSIDDVRAKKKALDEAKSEFYKEVREKTHGSSYYKDAKSSVDTAQGAVDKANKAYNDRVSKIMAGNDPNFSPEDIGNGRFDYESSEYEKKEAAAQSLDAAKSKKQAIEESLTDSALEKKFKDLKPGKDPDEELEKEEKGLRDKLSQIRHTEIITAIHETFPTDSKEFISNKIVKTIYLTAQDIYKYYNSELSSADAKDLSKAAGAKKAPASPAAPAPGPAPAAPSTPATGTVTIKPKTPAGSKTDPATARYEKQKDDMLKDLGNFKQIDYILFGDIIRLVYDRLYKVKANQILALQGYRPGDETRAIKSIEQSIMLFTEMTFDIFEASKVVNGKVEIDKNIYDIPIAVKNLQYILAKNLFGKQKSFFSIFELVQELIDLISLTRKRKVLLLNNEASFNNYQIDKITYPMEKNPKGNPKYKICTNPYIKQPDLYSSLLFTVNRIKADKPIKNARHGILPEFIFGGPDRGIIKKFQLQEIVDDDLQKMVYEQLTSSTGSQVIPSFFRVVIDTIMAPIFQLGMHIRVSAPTLELSSKSGGSGNLFIDGSYHVRGVIHTYSGGKFTTQISATMYNSERFNMLKKKNLVKPSAAATKATPTAASAAAAEYKKQLTPAAGAASAASTEIVEKLKSAEAERQLREETPVWSAIEAEIGNAESSSDTGGTVAKSVWDIF